MMRASIAFALCIALLASSVPAAAQDTVAPNLVPPSPAVAAAWATENASRKETRTAKALLVSYVALQTADMASTIAARRAGATEANPFMNTGFGAAVTAKSLTTLGSAAAVKAIEKKNPKAATLVMIALNSMTAMVVAKNVHNIRRLK
jgi:hypothetical protein